jgi:membrane fusion protein, multidrug efflux system
MGCSNRACALLIIIRCKKILKHWGKTVMKRSYLIGGVLFVAALGSAGYVYQSKQTAASQAAAAVPAASAKPKLELLASDVSNLTPIAMGQVLSATGSIRALQQAQVKSQVSALVISVKAQEGQTVAAGQVLATTDVQDYQSRLAGAQAALSQAQSQVLIAQRTVDNNKALVTKGFISETASDVAQQQLEVNKSAVKVAQTNIELAQKALKDTAIVSPIAGVVAEKLISAGDKVSPDMRVFTIIKPGSVEFEGSLPAAEAAQLRLGQAITVESEGLPALSATISRLNPAVSVGSRNVTFFASLKDVANYRPGSYATGKVQIKATNALAVPAAAVREEAGRSVVYTITASGELAASNVTVGLRGEDASGNTYAVVEGIEAGSRYISRNLGPLRVGSTVVIGK